MTYSYTADVATCSGFGCFLPLLLRWRGSIYKLVWLDLLSFLSLYYLLNFSYRYLMNPEQKSTFENVVKYCNNNSLIPLSFVLGFYVAIVMGRWWAQYLAIPWPDSIAVYVSAHIHGLDDHGRLLRRTVMRYSCLCLTMIFTYVSQRVKKRFPTWDYLVDAGLLLENEKVIIDRLDDLFPNYPKHWLPIVWAASIVKRARSEGRIRDDFAVKTIIDELNKFRGSAGFVLTYDWISVPLVYTQVVTLAVYSYFIFNIFGTQYIEKPNESGYYHFVDKYFPLFATLEFFFYMGWLKVAESLINPFGEDDDDFEINWLVDRNILVSYLIVDEMHNDHPELVRDQYWDEVFPSEIRTTTSTKGKREEHPEPSTFKVAAQTTDHGRPSGTLSKASRSYVFPKKANQRNASTVSYRTSIESIDSMSSAIFKQVGVVTPLNVSKTEVIKEKTEPVDIIDDFEILRRRREQERIQRHAYNLNRTVQNLHSVADSSTIIQLIPTRPITITDSESSIANDVLSDDQPENNKDKTKALPKVKTKARVTISEPIKSEDKFEHPRQTIDNQSLERRSSRNKQIMKLTELASKAKAYAEKPSTSKKRSAAVGLQTDKAALPADKATEAMRISPVPSRDIATDVISDSDGSISFLDVQDAEANEDENTIKNKQKLQNRQRNESEASTIYSDASDGLPGYEKPELFRDKSADSEESSRYQDAESKSAVNDASEQSKGQQAETDASTEFYDPQEESEKAESEDKTKPKTQDKTKKKR